LPPPSGDSEETRRALEALSKALDALLTAQDQTSLSKALDALIASQAQGTAVKEIQEKVCYLGSISRTYLPQISKITALAGQIEGLDGKLAEIAAGREAQTAQIAEMRENILGWLEHIGDTQADQLAMIDRVAKVQTNEANMVTVIYETINALKNLPHQHKAPDVGPVVKVLEGIHHGITNRMTEMTYLTTRIKTLEEKIDKAVKGIPPQGGVSGYLDRNLPKEKLGVPLITSILDNNNSPETFLNDCMEPEDKTAIQMRFLYRVYAAWTYERYTLPINITNFKRRIEKLAAEKRIAIDNLSGTSHLVGLRFKPDVIAPVQ
jgi:hypothetical protein